MLKQWAAFIAVIGAACLFGVAILILTMLAFAFARPPQPLPFGTVQWDYETGFTVDGVRRLELVRDGTRIYRARGEFYLVRARVVCPFGERFHWDDRDVAVETFSGSGGTQPTARFSIDEAIQAIVDRQTHRPGPQHTVLGATQSEYLVFDLPKNVEQPALVFFAANDPFDIVDNLREARIWQPHRFNIRYD